MPLVIPEAVRRKAEVAGAVAWLVELPSLVAELEEEWAISVGPSFADATEAFVASAVCDDGTPVVLKLMVLRAGNAAANEITVLRLADGDGCARLLRSDASRGALLLEALGPSLNDLALPIRRRLRSSATRLERCGARHRTAVSPTGADKGQWLIEFIEATWASLGGPCSRRAVTMRSSAPRAGSPRTPMRRRPWCMATSISGTAWSPATASSSSTRTGCLPTRLTTLAS